MQVLKEQIYQDWISTQEHIESLSNSKNKISEIETVNMIVKFSVDYILTWVENTSFEKDSLSAEEIISNAVWSLMFQYRWLLSSIIHSDIYVNKEIDILCLKVSYQLKMLLDFPKTLALVLEIISRKIPYNSKWYNGLDLWTGSGILLLAQYIQARRSGFWDDQIRNIWIELSPDWASVWNRLAQKLQFWQIIQWDTTKKKTIQELWFPFLTFVSNENLPYEKNPLFKEPFIENLYSLMHAWYKLSEIEGLFPEIFYYTNHPPYTPNQKVPKKIDIKSKDSFYAFLDNYEDSPKNIKVPNIQLGTEQKPLSLIGQDFESTLFNRDFLCVIWKRW